jgi:hypothetical protein
MTEQWKPVAHYPGGTIGGVLARPCYPESDGGCECNGTRWPGYGERVGDCAAVWALCEWFLQAGKPRSPNSRLASCTRPQFWRRQERRATLLRSSPKPVFKGGIVRSLTSGTRRVCALSAGGTTALL